MNQYIALLRGINVSGQKKILMADLRTLLEKEGLGQVKTYIQSGNIICSCNLSKQEVELLIGKALLKKYGWDIPVLVLTHSEIVSILDACPFPQDKKEKSYFVLLQTPPNKEYLEKINALHFPKEEFVITSNCVYLYSEIGAANSKLSTNFFENKLKVKATARNYRTMAKLIALASL